MGRKIKGSILPIIFFLLSLSAFAVFYFLYLRDYLCERVDPSHVSEEKWISALNTFFYLSMSLTAAIVILWFIVSWLSNPEPTSMRRKWVVFFVLTLVVAIVVPVLFLIFFATTSGTFNAIIVAYFFLLFVVTYFLSTIICYSEIRYCSGFWRLLGR